MSSLSLLISGECHLFLWSIYGNRMASVMSKCNGMENWLSLVLRTRPCNVDKLSAGISTDHAGMSRSIFQHGLSCLLPYNWSGVSSVHCQHSPWPTAWHVRGPARRRGQCPMKHELVEHLIPTPVDCVLPSVDNSRTSLLALVAPTPSLPIVTAYPIAHHLQY
jgi:hypothetical protein